MSLVVNQLSFRYGQRQILDQVSFEAPFGEVLALLGPNGTGKTTLLRCISKLITPYEGSSLVSGNNLFTMKEKERARYVGYVPQHTNSTFPISVADAVMMGRAPFIRFHPSKKDKEIVFSLLQQLELEQYAFTPINELSGGERQRVFIARALAQQPKVLLLDEPTSSMDLKYQLRTLSLVRQLARTNKLAVVVSIHDLNLAAMFCDRFLMLNNRKVFAYGTGEQVLRAEVIEQVYEVKVTIQTNDGRHQITINHPEIQ